jgi:uncharacterized membrane protein YpjA
VRFRLFAKDVECARVSLVLVLVVVVVLLSRMMSSLRSLCISSSKKYSIYMVSMEVKCTFKVYLVVMEIHRRRVL